MNKLITKIATACVGLAMAVGVGVAIGNGSAQEVRAGGSDATFTITLTGKSLKNATSYQNDQTTANYNGGDATASLYWGRINPNSGQISGNSTTQSNLQGGSANFYIHNTTALNGNIRSITISGISGTYTANKAYAQTGSSAISNQTTANSTAGTNGTNSITWSFTGTSGGFFAVGAIKGLTSGTVTASTITVVYEPSTETHYISAMSVTSSTDPLSVPEGTAIDDSMFTVKGTKDGTPNTTLTSSEFEFLGSGVKNGNTFTVSSTTEYTLGDNYLGWESKLDTSSSDSTKVRAYFPVTVTAVPEKKFVLLTDASSIAAGTKIILGNSNEAGAVEFLSTEQKTSNRGAVEKTTAVASGDTLPSVTLKASTVEILTVGGSAGSWSLQPQAGGYLYASSSSANQLKTQDANDSNGLWAITIDSTSDEATITAQGSNTRNLLRYNPNNGSPVFSCYASDSSTGNLPYIYKYEEPVDTNKVLSSLSVTGTLTKSDYVEGQVFDPSGLTIEAVFTDSNTYPNEDVTSLVSWSDLEIGDTTVTGSYTFQGVTKTCEIAINAVTAKALSSISLAGASGNNGNNKFNARQAFNIEGVTITAHFNNGTTAQVAHSDAGLAILLDEVDITAGHIFSDSEASTEAENHTIKITYTYSGVTKYSTYKISVSPYVNPIGAIYSKTSGASVDVYGYYVGFLDGTGPIIMDGEYGIVIYNKSADVSGYTEKETILHVTGSVSIYKGLYEIGSATISVASGEYTAPSAPVVYSTSGGETADYASRLTTVTGVPTTSGDLTADPGTSDITLTFTVGDHSIQVFYKKAAQDADDMALLKAAVDGEDEITIKGFTGWYDGFQVQMKSVVPAVDNYTALEFAQDLLDQTDAVCDNYDGVTSNHDALQLVWSDLASADKYPSLPTAQKEILATADRDEEGTVIEQAMARYDYLTGKYNLSNFINGRTPVQFVPVMPFITSDNNGIITITVIISVISLSAVGGFFFIRKKRLVK